ncbi:DUF418 domain-containing protein [Corynebacterium frankenforstense]
MSRPRLTGLDLARGLAVLGMMVAHLGPKGGWIETATDGFPSAMFAVLAGCSLSLMNTRADAEGGPAVARARFRAVVRGLLLVAAGFVLGLLPTMILIVLVPVGAIYVLLSPLTRWRTWELALSFVGLTLFSGLAAVVTGFTGGYPPLAWLAYGVFGMLLHRVFFAAREWAVGTALLGAALGATGLVHRHLVEPVVPWSDGEATTGVAGAFFSPVGHSSGLLDVLCSCGMAAALTGLCLWICHAPAPRRAVFPLRAVGTMALTVYVLHVLTATIPLSGIFDGTEVEDAVPYTSEPYSPYGDKDFDEFREEVAGLDGWEDWTAYESRLFEEAYTEQTGQTPGEIAVPAQDGHPWWLAGSVLAALVLCPLWRRRFERGPLEALMRRTIDRMTTETLPARPARRIADAR